MAHVPVGSHAGQDLPPSWQDRLSDLGDRIEDIEGEADDAGAEELRHQLAMAKQRLQQALDAARAWEDPK